MNLYTKEMFLIAAEKCEVSMIDANHIMKYIDEYVTPIELPSDESGFICKDENCKHCAEDIAQMQDEDDDLTPDEQIIKDLYNDRKSHAIDFAKWLAKEFIPVLVEDKWLWETDYQKNWLGYFTEEQLYEFYLKET